MQIYNPDVAIIGCVPGKMSEREKYNISKIIATCSDDQVAYILCQLQNLCLGRQCLGYGCTVPGHIESLAGLHPYILHLSDRIFCRRPLNLAIGDIPAGAAAKMHVLTLVIIPWRLFAYCREISRTFGIGKAYLIGGVNLPSGAEFRPLLSQFLLNICTQFR